MTLTMQEEKTLTALNQSISRRSFGAD